MNNSYALIIWLYLQIMNLVKWIIEMNNNDPWKNIEIYFISHEICLKCCIKIDFHRNHVNKPPQDNLIKLKIYFKKLEVMSSMPKLTTFKSRKEKMKLQTSCNYAMGTRNWDNSLTNY